MKSVYKIFAVILAAGLTVMSCDKKPINEDIPVVNPEGDDETDPADGPRVITVSFNTKATRTVLDEDTLIPSFAKGDVIVVTDGNVEERCPVYFDGEYARINITEDALQDIDVTAVYPESAYIGTSPYFKVPSVQDGSFANANICTTTIKANETKAKFYNKTAVFRIELENLYSYDDYPNYGIGVNEVTISSLGKIENGHRGTTKSPISSDTESEKITIPRGEKYYYCPLYISVLCDGDNSVLLADLNFDINYDFYADWVNDYPTSSPTSMGGFSPKFLAIWNLKTEKVKPGAIYTGVEDHLHAYHINSHYSGSLKIYKWADEDLETDGGDFFMWGELDGHSYDNGWTNFTENSNGFASGNSPNYSTSFSISSYNSGDILRLEDDAVYQNWGGAWRMPTYEEMSTLSNTGNDVTDGISDYSYVDGNSQPISVEDGITKYYWTSEKGTDSNNGNVYPYYFQDSQGTRFMYTQTRKGTITELPFYSGVRIKPMSGVIEAAE